MKKSICLRWGGALLLSALVMLAFASHTSPVYDLLLGDYGSNTASAAMLIGKSWAEEDAVPYRDLFAMGGPLYFLFQALGWFAGGRTGIFVLEVVSFALFLGLTAETIRRFTSNKTVMTISLLLSVIVFAALSAAGNSTFEWCLPFVAGGFLIALRPGRMFRCRDAALLGLLCGCVLLIDFRAGGLLYGAALGAVFCAPKEGSNKIWMRLICWMTGTAVPVLIALAGFMAVGDLTGMLQGTFLYPARALFSGFESLQMVIHKGVKCLLLLPLLTAGILLVARNKQEKRLGVCVLLSSMMCGLLLLCGDNRWYYYLAALPAVPLGIALLCPGKVSLRRITAESASLLLVLGLCAVPLKNTISFLLTGVPDVICEFYEDAQGFEDENPGYRYIAVDTDCSYFLLLDKLPEYRYFTNQTELSLYDPAVAEAVEVYLNGEPADILFITERGYIGRELDKYTLVQVYLEYGGSLFVYLPNE